MLYSRWPITYLNGLLDCLLLSRCSTNQFNKLVNWCWSSRSSRYRLKFSDWSVFEIVISTRNCTTHSIYSDSIVWIHIEFLGHFKPQSKQYINSNIDTLWQWEEESERHTLHVKLLVSMAMFLFIKQSALVLIQTLKTISRIYVATIRMAFPFSNMHQPKT